MWEIKNHANNFLRRVYFTRNTYNEYVYTFKTLFRRRSQACFAIVTTMWRPGLRDDSRISKFEGSYVQLIASCEQVSSKSELGLVFSGKPQVLPRTVFMWTSKEVLSQEFGVKSSNISSSGRYNFFNSLLRAPRTLEQIATCDMPSQKDTDIHRMAPSRRTSWLGLAGSRSALSLTAGFSSVLCSHSETDCTL